MNGPCLPNKVVVEKPNQVSNFTNLIPSQETDSAITGVTEELKTSDEKLSELKNSTNKKSKGDWTFLGLLTNLATYNSQVKYDLDAYGNIVTDGWDVKRKYRSVENGSRIKAIKKRQQELLEAQGISLEELEEQEENEKKRLKFITENDIQDMLAATTSAIRYRILGPLAYNWTHGEDFLATLKYALSNILKTIDPIVKLIEPIQKQIYGNIDTSFGIDVPTASGQQLQLPLGMMALDVLMRIVGKIEEILRHLETIANEYTVEELNALLKYIDANKSQLGGQIDFIHELLQLILDCIKPYIQNLIMALIFDAIDVIVDALKKAGILDPDGPLALIPNAITLVRALCRGDLEAMEEMLEKTVQKLVNLVQLLAIAMKDKSILWADLDTLDEAIYEAMGEPDPETTFHSRFSLGAGTRRILQGLAGSSRSKFDEIRDFANRASDLNLLYSQLKGLKRSSSIDSAMESQSAEVANNAVKEAEKNTDQIFDNISNKNSE